MKTASSSIWLTRISGGLLEAGVDGLGSRGMVVRPTSLGVESLLDEEGWGVWECLVGELLLQRVEAAWEDGGAASLVEGGWESDGCCSCRQQDDGGSAQHFD